MGARIWLVDTFISENHVCNSQWPNLSVRCVARTGVQFIHRLLNIFYISCHHLPFMGENLAHQCAVILESN